MIKTVLSFVCVVIIGFSISSYKTISNGSLEVRISGLNSTKGNLALSVFNSPTGFPSEAAKAVTYKIVAINATYQTIVVDNLPYGTYAVAVMHDENTNGRLDTNLFGIPQEGVGVSNNALGTFSAPAFEECSFLLGENKKTIEITMEYW